MCHVKFVWANNIFFHCQIMLLLIRILVGIFQSCVDNLRCVKTDRDGCPRCPVSCQGAQSPCSTEGDQGDWCPLLFHETFETGQKNVINQGVIFWRGWNTFVLLFQHNCVDESVIPLICLRCSIFKDTRQTLPLIAPAWLWRIQHCSINLKAVYCAGGWWFVCF